MYRSTKREIKNLSRLTFSLISRVKYLAIFDNYQIRSNINTNRDVKGDEKNWRYLLPLTDNLSSIGDQFPGLLDPYVLRFCDTHGN